jgi:uncharacterized membrane protein YhaH (DUF805 family)
MEFLRRTLKDFFSGRLTRLEYVTRVFIVFLISLGIVTISTFLLRSTAKGELSLSIGAVLVYILAGIVILVSSVYSIGCNIRRFRDVFSTIPNSEVYFIFILFFILGFIPGIGLLFNILLMITSFLLPSNFSRGSFYQENLNEVISHWTKKVLGRK